MLQISKNIYPSIIKSKSKERQLEVEVLMDLRRGRVNVSLVVSQVLAATLVVEPVEEVGSDLIESGVRDDIGLAIVLVACGRKDSAVDVSYECLIKR